MPATKVGININVQGCQSQAATVCSASIYRLLMLIACFCHLVPCRAVLQLPLTSRSPSENWVTQECTSAIQSQQNFELQLNISTNQPRLPGSGSPPLGAPLLQGQFRCAANTGLDNNMLPIGIPNFLPNEAAGARSFYFATLRQAAKPCGSLQLQPQSSDALESGSTSGNGVSGSGGNRQRRECAPRGAQFSLMATNHDPMPDIKLGPLLGKGAFGRVYRGEWGSPLACGCGVHCCSMCACSCGVGKLLLCQGNMAAQHVRTGAVEQLQKKLHRHCVNVCGLCSCFEPCMAAGAVLRVLIMFLPSCCAQCSHVAKPHGCCQDH